MSTNFREIPAGFNEKVAKLPKALKYLYELDEPSKILLNSQAYDALAYVLAVLDEYEFREENRYWTLIYKTEAINVLIGILGYLSKLPVYRVRGDEYENDLAYLNKIISIISMSTNITEASFTNNMLFDINKRFFDKNCLEFLLNFFKETSYFYRCVGDENNHHNESLRLMLGHTVSGLMKTIRNLSLNYNNNKKVFIESNTNEHIRKAASKFAKLDTSFSQYQNEIAYNLRMKNFSELFEQLNMHSHEPAKLVSEQSAYEAIFQIDKLIKYEMNRDDQYVIVANQIQPTTNNQHASQSHQIPNNFAFLLKYKCEILFVNILNHISEVSEELDSKGFQFSQYENNELPNDPTTLNERRLLILHHIINIITRLTEFQFKNVLFATFTKRYFHEHGLQALTNFFKNDKFHKKLNDSSYEQDYYLIRHITQIIRNLSLNVDFDKKIWHDLNVLGLVKQFNSTLLKYNDEYMNLIKEININIEQPPLKKCLEYLNGADLNGEQASKPMEPSKIIVDYAAYKNFLFMYKVINRPIFNQWHLFTEYKCDRLFGDILFYFYEICDQLDFVSNDISFTYPRQSPGLNELRISNLIYLLRMTSSITHKSIDFNLKYSANLGLIALLSFLSNESFVKRLSLNYKNSVINMLNSLTYLSRYADENRKRWLELNPVENLIKITRLFNTNKTIIDRAYDIIANVVDDKRIDLYYDLIDELLDNGFCADLASFADYMDTHNEIKRLNIEYFNDDKQIEIFNVCFSNNSPLIRVLTGLTNLSINDSLKPKIFKHFDSIKVILLKGNEIEKRFTLFLIAQLCFSDDIRAIIKNDKTLLYFLSSLLANNQAGEKVGHGSLSSPGIAESPDGVSLLKRLIKKIYWLLENMGADDDASNTSTNMVGLNQINNIVEMKQVMISSNSFNNSHQICSKIKKELEKSGYKVYLNDNSSNVFEEMASAIENSFCVIIGMNEKYRQSINCQAEAKYAFKLKKPIIPLVMQSDFEFKQGWLKAIIKNRIVINFVKYDFDESMKRLKKELIGFMQTSSAAPSIAMGNSGNSGESAKDRLSNELDSSSLTNLGQLNQPLMRPTTAMNMMAPNQRRNAPEEWNEEQVYKWFLDAKIHRAIIEAFNPSNGIILEQLYLIKNQSPEFFFQSLSSKTGNQLDLKDIALFTGHLDKLFKSKRI